MALDKEEIGERVLGIAERLVEEGGGANLKARSIAEQAGIAVGSVYNLFGDLDGLHRAVNIRLLDRLGQAGTAAMAELARQGVIDPRQRLLALARAYLGFVEAHPRSWPALLAFNRQHDHQSQPDAYAARLVALFEIIAAVLAEGGFALEEQQRKVAARALWSSVHGIVTSGYVAAGGRQAAETWEQIDLLVTVFIAGLERRGFVAQSGVDRSGAG